MSKILKAKEFLKEKDDYGHLSVYADETAIIMIEFAKLHVEVALEQALEDSPTGSSTDIPSYEDMKNSILNAYPLENIK